MPPLGARGLSNVEYGLYLKYRVENNGVPERINKLLESLENR